MTLKSVSLSDHSWSRTPLPTTLAFDTVVPTLTYPGTPFSLGRHVVCTTRAQHDSAVSSIIAGDWIDCQGITFSGEVEYNFTSLGAYAKITYDSGCSFTGVSAGSNLPAIWVRNCNYLQLIFGSYPTNNCPITNIGGDGILVSGGDHLVIDGFLIHDVGRQGLYNGPTVAEIKNSFFRGEAYNIGLNHSFDLHAEKGTGLHCNLNADTDTFAFHDNTVAIYGHDCTFSGGCVCQVGDNSVAPYNNVYYVKAANMLMEATSQIAGNGVNLWGLLHDEDFKCVETNNMMGRAVDCNGVYAATLTNVQVEYGRAHNGCQNPNLASTESGISSSENWDHRHGVNYSGNVLTV